MYNSKRFIAYPLAPGMYKYIELLMDSGVMTGELGHNELSENLRPVVKAIHHILAGGSVEIQVVEPGVQSKVQKLERTLAEGTEEANALNAAAGFYVSIAP